MSGSPRPLPDLMILGTARSGTTLVQRIASELDGVVVPPETHFFDRLAEPLLRSRRFPIDAVDLMPVIERYVRRQAISDLQLGAERIVARVGERCSSALALFDAILREMVNEAPVVGEKTPSHLPYWKPLATAHPHLRFIAVVRDPRAVIASTLSVPWGRSHVALLAHRWALDQASLLRARRELDEARLLQLHYEDIVADSGAARARIASFLNATPPTGPGSPPRERELFHEWETWKAAAVAPPDPARVGAWREELTEDQSLLIAAICRREMSAFGYPVPSRAAAVRRVAILDPRLQARRARMSIGWRVKVGRLARHLAASQDR